MGRAGWLGVLGVAALAGDAGCGASGSEGAARVGTEGAHCYANGTCNTGLSCFSSLCVDPGNTSGSGGARSTGGAGVARQLGGAPGSGSGGMLGSAGAFQLGGAAGGLVFDGGGAAAGGAGGSGGAPPACVGHATRPPTSPVDLYVMFDQSSSMGDPLPDNSDTWWGAAQKAVTSFVNDARTAGMGVGIQYFPLGGVAPASCSASYSTPEVEVGLLPGNALLIATSVQNHNPTAFTPTAPALQGAVDHMKAWAPAHAGRAPVVVLVTDGFPTECDPQQVTDIAAIAGTAFQSAPAVRTFVVGFNLGQAGANLDQIAKAGGSGKALLINGGAIGTQFVSDLLSIGGAPLSCTFDLPPPAAGAVLDPDLVSVRYTPNATGAAEEIVRVNNLGDCQVNQSQGWYYDSPSAPTKILTCPGTCAALAGGTVEVVQGCSPVRRTP